MATANPNPRSAFPITLTEEGFRSVVRMVPDLDREEGVRQAAKKNSKNPRMTVLSLVPAIANAAKRKEPKP